MKPNDQFPETWKLSQLVIDKINDVIDNKLPQITNQDLYYQMRDSLVEARTAAIRFQKLVSI